MEEDEGAPQQGSCTEEEAGLRSQLQMAKETSLQRILCVDDGWEEIYSACSELQFGAVKGLIRWEKVREDAEKKKRRETQKGKESKV